MSDFANSQWDPETPGGHADGWSGWLLDFGPDLGLAVSSRGGALEFTWREYPPGYGERDGLFDENSERHALPAQLLGVEAVGQDFLLTLGRTSKGESVLHQWRFHPRRGAWYARSKGLGSSQLGESKSLRSEAFELELVGDEYLSQGRPQNLPPRIFEVARSSRPFSCFALDPWGRYVIWLDAEEDRIFRSDLTYPHGGAGAAWPGQVRVSEPRPIEWPENVGEWRTRPVRPPEFIDLWVAEGSGVVLGISYMTALDFDNQNETLLVDQDNDGLFDARWEVEASNDGLGP